MPLRRLCTALKLDLRNFEKLFENFLVKVQGSPQNMGTSTVILLALVMVGCSVAQDPSSVLDWAKLLKTANDYALAKLSDDKDMNILSYPCHWSRKAGWHQFKVKYDGKISCPTISQEYSHSACLSKDCAWKEPFMLLIKDFIINNRAPKDGLVAAIKGSNLSEGEKQDLLKLAGPGY